MATGGGRLATGRLSMAICGRCGMKHFYSELSGDRNVGEAMRVCPDDNDDKDPWKLPARPSDPMALRFARPDVSIALNPLGVISEDGLEFIITEDGEEYLIPG